MIEITVFVEAINILILSAKLPQTSVPYFHYCYSDYIKIKMGFSLRTHGK
jgi:hypothetical protein